mmetsp:Transcript_9687/g.27304  ORF Transcript_9687/g.27304 Transcript_9687/m.27304 type:complete len:227 (+) Transcript_9687:147-827(+)
MPASSCSRSSSVFLHAFVKVLGEHLAVQLALGEVLRHACLLLEEHRDSAEEALEVDGNVRRGLPLPEQADGGQQLPHPGHRHLCAEVAAERLELPGLQGPVGMLRALEGRPQRLDLLLREETVQGRGLRAEGLPRAPHGGQRALEHVRGHGQADGRQHSGLRHGRRLLRIGACLGVDSGLGQVVGPFAHEDLAARGVEEGAAPLPLVVEPEPFVAVAVGLVQGALA